VVVVGQRAGRAWAWAETPEGSPVVQTTNKKAELRLASRTSPDGCSRCAAPPPAALGEKRNPLSTSEGAEWNIVSAAPSLGGGLVELKWG